jgi:hypothetical protein
LLIYGDVHLFLEIVTALLLRLRVAALVGVCAPVALQRFGRDPGDQLEPRAYRPHRQHGIADFPWARRGVSGLAKAA